MLYVDVHAHMDNEPYDSIGGISKVLDECNTAGVKTIISNGTSIESNRRILDLSSKHSQIKSALGIYPTDCLEMIENGMQKEFDLELVFIEKKIFEKKCIAIGEVGLEYKTVEDLDENKKNIMKDCLIKFISLAKKHDIPIILHSRGAELELVELLESEGMQNKKVIMHCFSGRKHIAKRIKDNGWFFSIPCNIARSQQFQDIVEMTPLTQLFTETDSPYLAPNKEEINTPKNIPLTIEKIAQIKKMTPEETANILYNNFQKVFL